ncbi:hypothetical protein F5887DRAFT_920926 [Amanita rubescens]|nr:hypothetical protein F5887DRAFT_920926 [Amanita rubescens]
MDDNYDWDGSALAELATERVSNKDSTLQLSEVTKAVKEKEPMEEVVLAIQGIIYRQDLPPFDKQIPASSTKQIKYLRQGVSLTGLGTPLFDSSIKAITDIYALFCRSVPREKLQPCSFIDHYGKYTGIEMSNRYFSPRKDFPTSKTIPFNSDTDPKGILTRAAGTTFIHTDHNVVTYYERSAASNGKTSYKEIAPVKFCVGDLVEAQFSLMLVPLRGEQYKLTPVLRCLTMLDASFSQPLALPTSIISFKRKVGYSDRELVVATHETLGRMEVDVADERHNMQREKGKQTD